MGIIMGWLFPMRVISPVSFNGLHAVLKACVHLSQSIWGRPTVSKLSVGGTGGGPDPETVRGMASPCNWVTLSLASPVASG